MTVTKYKTYTEMDKREDLDWIAETMGSLTDWRKKNK